MNSFTLHHSPIGILAVEQADNAIVALHLDGPSFVQTNPEIKREDDHPLLQEAVSQLVAYFKGERIFFNLPFSPVGTAFQTDVWRMLDQIPYGKTVSYGDIASAIQKPKAVRAVGQANKRNPLPIFIPCHRVVGTNKSLTGYAGNQVDKKAFLLELEQKHALDFHR